jgi:hypothetical protein
VKATLKGAFTCTQISSIIVSNLLKPLLKRVITLLGPCWFIREQFFFTAENEVATRGDVTAHAELLLVQKAQKLERSVLGECVLYASTKPFAMCAGAIYWSGIRKVVF